MYKLTNKNTLESTKVRYNKIHKIYDEIMNELGELKHVVSKGYVYGKIQERTKLSIRTISFIINHTKPS